jgi:hypothetical protein
LLVGGGLGGEVKLKDIQDKKAEIFRPETTVNG